MRRPGRLDRWMTRRGWKLVMVLMTVAALVRAWQMWRDGVG